MKGDDRVHHLSRCIYAMEIHWEACLSQSLKDLEQRNQDRQHAHLQKMASVLGFALVPQ